MATESPNASGYLRKGISRYDALSINNIYSIFMYTNFKPFKINSGFYFMTNALFNIDCDSKAFALWAMATTLLAQGCGFHILDSKSPTEMSPFATALAILVYVRQRLAHRTVLLHPDQIGNVQRSRI